MNHHHHRLHRHHIGAIINSSSHPLLPPRNCRPHRVPDLPELLTLHKMFAQKYGKEYVQEASSDAQCHKCVS